MFRVLGAIVVAAGCSKRAAEPAPPTEAAVVARPVEAKTKPADSAEPAQSPPPVDLEGTLCGERSPCQVRRIWDAGKDEAGRAMQVVKLSLKPDGTRPVDLTDQSPDEVTESVDDNECEPLEYWFVRPAFVDDDAAGKPALLVEVCNSGYGMTGMGIDTITVKPGLFSYSRSGAMGSFWTSGRDVQLPSLRIVETFNGAWHRTLPEASHARWNWAEFAGYDGGYDVGCDKEADPSREEISEGNFAYEPIPQPSIPVAYRENGWKETSLGSCGARVTSTGNGQPEEFDTGFVVHGKPGAASDASFKVVMTSATEMFVEVFDDVWVEEADSILGADHLELWASTGPECPRPTDNLFQWGITLDGAVQTLYGKPKKQPTVESVRVEGGPARFKIALPEQYEKLTVVYSDSDDGKSQKRLIATSAFKHRDPFTMGATKVIAPSDGRCEVKNGKLDFAWTYPPPRSPVIGSDI